MKTPLRRDKTFAHARARLSRRQGAAIRRLSSKKLPTVVAIFATIVAIGCGATAVTLYQLRATQMRLLETARLEEEARIKRHTEELAKLREQNEIYKRESRELREKLAAKTAVASAAPAATTAEPQGASDAEKKEGGDFMKGIAKMYQDPEMKVMRTQQAMGIRMMYGDLAKELGLPRRKRRG